MRRSLVVRLTLLPMLAAAAVVYADPPAQAPLVDPLFDSQPPMDTSLSPPGGPVTVTGAVDEQVFTPPGMTPPLDCADDPDADDRDECYETGVTISGGIVRGGFGHYFWISGG
jgi:hypothetical protein